MKEIVPEYKSNHSRYEVLTSKRGLRFENPRVRT
jgi:hypothetical protein